MRNQNYESRQMTASWFSIPKPNARAKLRLFCLPYAGSGANIFYRWHRDLPESVELVLVHLPGRERRMKEKPFDRISPLVESLGRALLCYADKPMAFFGHSLGGLVSFEVAKYLRREFGLQPAHLFLSACGGPKSMRLLPRFQSLSGDQFISGLRQLTGGGAYFDNPQFVEVMLPTLRADYTICETYAYVNAPPLNSAITVCGGEDDINLKNQCLEEWRGETTGAFALRLFQGDHFFIHSAESLVLNMLAEELGALANRVDQPCPALRAQARSA